MQLGSSSRTYGSLLKTEAAAAAQSEHQTTQISDFRELQQIPTTAYGQVICAEANFVRVNISHLDQPGDPHPSTTSSSSSNGNNSNSSSQTAAAAQPPKKQLLCTVRALLKKINQRVLVGDHVRVQPIDWTAGRGVVDAVQPRSSELADPAIANVDHVLLLFGLTHPPFEPAQVSRFLVSVAASGLPVTLALNKADLLPASEVAARLDQVAAWGYAAVAVSCETGQGLQQLAERLAGRVSVVAGPSGAGKSSLINALRLGRHKPDAPEAAAAAVEDASSSSSSSSESHEQLDDSLHAGDDCSSSSSSWDEDAAAATASSSSNSSSSGGGGSDFLAVGDVSKIGRGKHTTRTVTLIELPFGGLMADTPGFNQPTLDRVSSTQLAGLFPEFMDAQNEAGGCRFSDCMHLAEPGCAVTAADFERHEHYIKFLAEIKAREDYDVRVMQLKKQRREGAMKMKSGRGGAARFEARLNTKKHRTSSRRCMKQNMWDAESDDTEVPV